MSKDSLMWLGAIFMILCIILFAVSYYIQSFGVGAFGVVALIISVMSFIAGNEKE
jgi:membrane-bound ClpP family serine protease